jgi:hypothetical protein
MVKSLTVTACHFSLKALNDGRIQPWYATSVRGLALKPLRDLYCELMEGKVTGRYAELDVLEDASSSQDHYCNGCLKNDRCDYGSVFEPDLSIKQSGSSIRGFNQGLRGITFATPIVPTDTGWANISTGQELPLRLLAIGHKSNSLLALIAQTLSQCGRASGLWGRPTVLFDVDAQAGHSDDWSLSPDSLPTTLLGNQTATMRVELHSPFCLKRRSDDGRRHFDRRLTVPSFHDLLSNSVRTVRRAIVEYHDGAYLARRTLDSFVERAKFIEAVRNDLRAFSQDRSSRRRNASHLQIGCLGTIEYSNVPIEYLPWLAWAGRLGIGDSRNCGAGLFHVEVF